MTKIVERIRKDEQIMFGNIQEDPKHTYTTPSSFK